MKSPFRVCIAALLLLPSLSEAVSDTWTGNLNALWSASGNWQGGNVPGTGDTATFSLNSLTPTVDLGTGVTVNALLFDTNVASAYTIGTSALQTLTLNAGGNITMNSTVVNNQTIASGLALGTTATLSNASTTNNLVFSGVLSGATALTKAGAGVVELNGANTYTGVTNINGGIVKLGNAAGLGAAGTTNHTLVAVGATLDLNGLSIGETFGVSATTDAFADATASLINSNATAAAVTGSILFNGAGAMRVAGTGNITLSTVASTGTAAAVVITKDDAGTLTLGGTADNVSAGLTLNTGTVILDKGGSGGRALGSNSSVAAGATLSLRNGQTNGDQIFANVNLTLNGNFDMQGQSEAFNVLLGNSTGIVTNGHATASTLTLGANSSSGTYNGVIQNGTGAINFIKLGNGTQTLTNQSTYTGTTAVQAGGLTLDFAVAGGSAAANDILPAATALTLSNANTNRATVLTLTGEASATNTQTITSLNVSSGRSRIVSTSGAGGSMTLNLGAFTLGTGASVDFVLPASGAINTTSSDAVLGARGTVNNGAAYAQILSGQIVAFNGDLVNQTGVNINELPAYGTNRNLRIDNTSTGNAVQNTTPLSLATISFTDTVDRTLTIGTWNTLRLDAGGGILRGTSANAVIGEAGNSGTLTAGTVANDNFILTSGSTTGSLTINSVIANNAGGAVNIVTNGAGRTEFAAANTFTGSVVVQQGSLRISNSSGLGTTAGNTTVSDGAALELINNVTIGGEALSLIGTGVGSSGALRNISGNNTYGGTISFAATSSIRSDAGTLTLDVTTGNAITGGNFAITLGGAGDIVVNDPITYGGTSNGTFTKDGTGTLFLNASNSFSGSGTLTISAGVLRMSNGGALGGTTAGTSISANAALELTGGITTNESITLANTTGISSAGAVRNISGNNTISGSVTVDDGAGRINSDAGLLTISGETRGDPTSASAARTLTVGGASDVTLSGVVRNGVGTTPGVLNLAKDGAGNLTLSNAANTFTGTTVVNGGTLTLSGNLNTGTTVTANAGTTFNQTATGVIAGGTSLVLNNSTVTLSGTNTGTGATTLNGGLLTLNYDTGAGGTDVSKLANTGVLTLNGGTVTLQGGTHLEVVGSTTLTAGSTTTLQRTSGTAVIALGAITPGAGSSLNILGNNIASTTTANVGGILGGWATVTLAGVTDWAVNSGVSDGGTGSLIRAFTGSYTDITRLGTSTVPDSALDNVRIINGGTAGNITLASTATEINTLKMDASDGAATIAAPASVLMIGGESGGGILQTGTSGGLTIGTAASEGTLTTGGTANATGAVLNLTNESITNDLTIQSVIANNGTDVVSLAKAGAGRVVVNGANTFTGVVAVNAGTLHVGALVGASTTATLGATTAVSNQGTLIFRRTDTAAVDMAGVISGSGSVRYLGSGTSSQSQYTVNDANTYSGGTFIDDSRVATSTSASALGSGPVNIEAGGQAFLHNVTFSNAFTISGSGWVESAGTLGALRLNGSTLSNTVTLAANARIVGDNSTTGTINGVVSGAFDVEIGSGSNQNSGHGIVRFNAANTYTGTTTVLGYTGTTAAPTPTLIVGHSNALGSTSAGTTIMGSGTNAAGTGTRLQLAGGVTVVGETLTLNSSTGQQRASLYFATASASAAWHGDIVITGAANGGHSIYSEAANANLTIGASSANTITNSTGATLVLRGANSGGVNTVNSTINLGAGSVGKTDSSTWNIVSTNNTYTGTTTISTGVLGVTSVAANGTASSIGTGTQVVLGQNQAGGGGTGTFRFLGTSGGSTNRSIQILNGTTGGAGVIENTVAGQTLALSGNITTNAPASASSLTVTGAGNVTLSGDITGTPALALTKTGNGVLTLASATNTATGTTSVNAGSMNLSGVTGTGAVTVASGATLYGTGSVRGSAFTLSSGATLQAGAGTAQGDYGTLNFTPVSGSGTIDFAAGSTIVLGINPSGTSDRLNITGTGTNTLLFNSDLTVGPASFIPVAPEVFNLLDWTGLSAAPTFASRFSSGPLLLGNGDEAAGLNLPDVSGSAFIWDISSFTVDGTIALVAVPEPVRGLLTLIGLLGVFFRRRRC